MSNSFLDRPGAITGQFELTPHCNLNCKTCYVHECKEAGRATLPASFWLNMAKQAADEGMLVLSLTGGETLLYPQLDELMEGLSTIGLLISFNTNGTLIDEKRVEWFLKYCPHKINISLYGASDETYERFCGMKDGFTRVSRAIDLLMAAGLNVYLNGLLTPDNIHELPQMHHFAAQRGLVLHASSYAFPHRSHPGSPVCGKDRFSPEDAARASAYNSLLAVGSDAFRQQGAGTLQILELRKQGILCEGCTECRGGVQNFQVSWDGMLHPCAMYPQISVSPEGRSFSEARKILETQMQSILYPEKCTICERKDLCPVCKAAVYLETGGTTEAPEYLCRYAEAYEQILRKECADVSDPLPYCGNLHQHNCPG